MIEGDDAPTGVVCLHGSSLFACYTCCLTRMLVDCMPRGILGPRGRKETPFEATMPTAECVCPSECRKLNYAAARKNCQNVV